MQPVAIYARSSTSAQRLRSTTESQIAACKQLAASRGASVIGVFVDEDISGSTRLEERASASRLLRLCQTGAVDAIVVARLDRLSRKYGDLLESLNSLTADGIEVWSVAEGGIDSGNVSSPALLRWVDFADAELDVISERMHRGRDRVAQEGKWVGGPVPFGYDLDAQGCLIPSVRLIGEITEADVARSVFAAMSNGSSTVAQARRLQALGAIPGRRYSRKVVISGTARWLPSRVNAMLRNPVYAGTHELASRYGLIRRQVPALVDEETWKLAQFALSANRSVAQHPPRTYLLRGLILCANCGRHYAGSPTSRNSRNGWRDYYYKCGGTAATTVPEPAERCAGKALPASWIEEAAIDACVMREPGGSIGRALIERHITEIFVATTTEQGTDRPKTARVTIHFVDGTIQELSLTRRARRDRIH